MTSARVVALVVLSILATACSAAGPARIEDGTPPATAAAGAATPAPTIVATVEPSVPMGTAAPAPTPTATPAPDWNALPVAANEPVALARQMLMVENALRDPSVSGDQLVYLGHLQQLTYGRLADYPEWKETVLAGLPDALRTAVQGGLEAGKQLRSMSGPIPKTLPEWKIIAAAPIGDLLAYYKEAEAEFGVAWYYLAAIHLVETRMGRIRGLSSAGAQGPMQFMPATWAQYGKGDVNSDHDAILGAARYLKAAGAPGNMAKALFAYNHSNAYVNALIAYAEVMRADPAAYRGYHGWQVYYPTADGPVHLPVGWTKDR